MFFNFLIKILFSKVNIGNAIVLFSQSSVNVLNCIFQGLNFNNSAFLDNGNGVKAYSSIYSFSLQNISMIGNNIQSNIILVQKELINITFNSMEFANNLCIGYHIYIQYLSGAISFKNSLRFENNNVSSGWKISNCLYN